MLDRIRRAKEYQQKEADESALISELRIAASAAARDEVVFTGALAELQQANAAEDEGAAGAQVERPTAAPLQQKSTTGEGLREAAMQGIAAARRYNASKTAAASLPSQQSSPAASAPPESSDAASSMSGAAEWGQSGVGSAEKVCPLCWKGMHAHITR